MLRSVSSVLLSLLATGCMAPYVARSAWYQGELLASRRPVAEVMAEEDLPPRARAALDLVADVKRWGGEIGLAATQNYDTIAWGWDRTIWNLTACDRLSFRPRTWWFPFVGRVPYLGFFREADARRWARRLASEGLDVYLRTAGAYSTLGWFRDPILPAMLEWDEAWLASTVLHEMTHATVWIPGSVAFNESLATWVGEQAALRYLVERHGPHSPEVLATVRFRHDRALWVAMQQELVEDLSAIYASPTLSDDDKLAARERILGEVVERTRALPLANPAPWLEAARQGPWNNARLAQFRTYHGDDGVFDALLRATGGDLAAFLREVERITRGARDPLAALRAATADVQDS